MLDLVFEHLAEVLARGGGKEDAVARRFSARETEVCAAHVDLVLAGEREHRLRERLPALGRTRRRRQRERARMAERNVEEPLHHVRERDLLGADVDADPVEEVGAADTLRQLRERHGSSSAAGGRPGKAPSNGALSYQRSTRASPPRM